jgi:hypothetical protein
MLLDFDCGAQIKLGFAAEFSNVLVIYTHIVKKPEDMTSCQAHVTDFSQVRWGRGAAEQSPDSPFESRGSLCSGAPYLGSSLLLISAPQ